MHDGVVGAGLEVDDAAEAGEFRSGDLGAVEVVHAEPGGGVVQPLHHQPATRETGRLELVGTLGDHFADAAVGRDGDQPAERGVGVGEHDQLRTERADELPGRLGDRDQRVQVEARGQVGQPHAGAVLGALGAVHDQPAPVLGDLGPEGDTRLVREGEDQLLGVAAQPVQHQPHGAVTGDQQVARRRVVCAVDEARAVRQPPRPGELRPADLVGRSIPVEVSRTRHVRQSLPASL